MNDSKKGLFISSEGGSYFITFALVSSLFLLWGFCNGMIDVMDKHFQDTLHLTLTQSAWVQFAHYLGYFLMALPAGWLARKLGYRGGIVTGLLMVAVGGFWFIPATHIASFWAFLLGVCCIAAGLTFLETVANPYATLLGPKDYAATRINLAQSCNGVGWFFGPIAGSMYFYSTNAAGQSTGAETLWIPYAGVGVVVIVLAGLFLLAPVPDIKSEDDYHLDEANEPEVAAPNPPAQRMLSLVLLWLNIAVLALAVGMIGTAIATIFTSDEALTFHVFLYTALAVLLAGSVALLAGANRLVPQSIWMRPHFSAATIAQFFYVAAQAGIFAFFINYMVVSKSGVSEVPPIPASFDSGMTWLSEHGGFLQSWLTGWFQAGKDGVLHLTPKGASNLTSIAFLFFLGGRVVGANIMKKSPAHKVLGIFGVLSVAVTLLVFLRLGWLSVACVFLSYFFMSIMFPTIFALGIFGLGSRAKKAASFIVMAIMGGAIIPKLMGHIADVHGVAHSFIVPMICFIIVAIYACLWPAFSGASSMHRK